MLTDGGDQARAKKGEEVDFGFHGVWLPVPGCREPAEHGVAGFTASDGVWRMNSTIRRGFGIKFIFSLFLLRAGDDGGELAHGTAETATAVSLSMLMVVADMGGGGGHGTREG